MSLAKSIVGESKPQAAPAPAPLERRIKAQELIDSLAEAEALTKPKEGKGPETGAIPTSKKFPTPTVGKSIRGQAAPSVK